MSTEIFISIVFLILGAMQFLFFSNKINYFFGYRTKKSMKNIENWKLSNKYASTILMLFSTFNILLFYSISFFINELSKNSIAVLFMLEFIILIYLTEKKLNQNENK
ncbi:membrane hypothetical protein [Flavobacterium psychrophilum]|uniref:SdpI family protein n=1 Tax=Flavobacterium psychrophilum TaxID=96345 RepID=UPI000B7C37AD|nr:SdpI family protein [Flavobacterium psychrophilum]SNB08021.1 membrane hypothetical protein [Flavobacterium psychrophilum]SNB10320.1 membrane hypothetical protein [Flavobacterium psychrophilum]SNB25766.1 membrane hypothetical protein [Flavobacterium psychrophilum]GEJ31022.1 hypothetical protein FPN184_contig00008-0006 [Flavobacterium psychrophilum]GEJ49842.1 hypothetical protein FPKKA176_contig00039-0006 [Flavobacterium psychrophilum]